MPTDRVINGLYRAVVPCFVQIVPITPCTKGRSFETTKAPRTLFPVSGATRSTWSGVNEVVDEWRWDVLEFELWSSELLVLVDTRGEEFLHVISHASETRVVHLQLGNTMITPEVSTNHLGGIHLNLSTNEFPSFVDVGFGPRNFQVVYVYDKKAFQLGVPIAAIPDF
jgi:hypothetical protein